MGQRKGRYRLEDVARLAGVGIASVDRVLNERGGVSAKTEQRILDAARELGLRRSLPAPHMRHLIIEVILARSTSPFMIRLGAAVGQVAATLDRSITVLRTNIDMTDPARVATRIKNSRANGIIVYCEEHPQNIEAMTEAVKAGRQVICVVTDVPDAPRVAYVGIDHKKAGRTAAYFVARMGRRSGTVLVLSTSTGFRAHKQRIEGFKDALLHYAPTLFVAPVLTTHDDPEKAYHHVKRAVQTYADLAAVYNTGGGNEGVGHALRGAALEQPALFVGHELTDESAVLLKEGIMTMTIDQAPELQARRAIDIMVGRLGAGTRQATSGEIAFTLHTVENF